MESIASLTACSLDQPMEILWSNRATTTRSAATNDLSANAAPILPIT